MVSVAFYHPKTKSRLGQFYCVPDTGAMGTIAPASILGMMGLSKKQLGMCTDSWQSVNNGEIKTSGCFTLLLKAGRKETREQITFCSDVDDIYLSRSACRRLGFIHEGFPQQVPKTGMVAACNDIAQEDFVTPELINQFQDLFFSHFSDVFSEEAELKAMRGPPMKIYLKKDAKPFALRTARSIPFALRSQVKAEIDRLVKIGVWKPVGDRPTEWCHPLVIVPKTGSVRLCVDLTKLNTEVERIVHPAATPKEIIASIPPGSKWFSKFDAVSGYWQMALAEDSQDLTCVITPWGRFVHTRSPMGFISTGDTYNLRGDQALGDLPQVEKIVDDSLVHSLLFKVHIEDTWEFLSRCQEHGITLSKSKMAFCVHELDFVGYHVSWRGISPNPKKLDAIANFPKPCNITDLRSFMGLVNQLGQFSKKVSETAEPLRGLLKKKNVFLWLPCHESAFQATKEALLEPPVLAHYNPDAELFLETDASKLKGLGFALFQRVPRVLSRTKQSSTPALQHNQPSKVNKQNAVKTHLVDQETCQESLAGNNLGPPQVLREEGWTSTSMGSSSSLNSVGSRSCLRQKSDLGPEPQALRADASKRRGLNPKCSPGRSQVGAVLSAISDSDQTGVNQYKKCEDGIHRLASAKSSGRQTTTKKKTTIRFGGVETGYFDPSSHKVFRTSTKTSVGNSTIPTPSLLSATPKVSHQEPPVLQNPSSTTSTNNESKDDKENNITNCATEEFDYQLIECGSRFLADPETRYAVCELEALAILWAVKKLHLYLAGRNFTVITDHKPLIPIFNTKCIGDVDNVRIQAYRLKLARYGMHLTWKKGLHHVVPDALSRAPVQIPGPEDVFPDTEESLPLICALKVNAAAAVYSEESKDSEDLLVNQIRENSEDDPEVGACLKYLNGDSTSLPPTFSPVREELEASNGVLLHKGRLVIPVKMRKEVLQKLHQSHQGIQKTSRRAQQCVFWPGIMADIKYYIETCDECQTYKPKQQREPMISDPMPRYPFQRSSSDLFFFEDRHYLVYACMLSGYPLVHRWNDSPSSLQVIRKLREYFSVFGIPTILRSDNGPQYSSAEFQAFLKEYHVEWRPSSPHYPQSNGHAEASVKAMKRLCQKITGDVNNPAYLLALQEFRNTPNASGKSPNQWVFGRSTRSDLPCPETILTSSISDQDVVNFEKRKIQSQQSYNKTAKELPPLSVGDKVRIQDPQSKLWNVEGVILAVDNKLRKYVIETFSGNLHRNRSQIRVMAPSVPPPISHKDSTFSGNLISLDKAPNSGNLGIKSPMTHQPPKRKPGRPKGSKKNSGQEPTRRSKRLNNKKN